MTTAAVNKRDVQPSWSVAKMQEEMTKLMAGQIIARLLFIEHNKPDEVNRYEKQTAHQRARVLQDEGVDSPLALVTALAEHEANLFGAKVAICNDERSATLFNEMPAPWLKAKQMANMTQQQEQVMLTHYRGWVRDLGDAFGFEAKVEVTNNGNSSQITFTRRELV